MEPLYDFRGRTLPVGTGLTANAIVDGLLRLHAGKHHAKPVTIYVVGGNDPAPISAVEAMMIAEVMRTVRSPLRTAGFGLLTGWLPLILACGTVGQRYLLPHTLVSLSPPDWIHGLQKTVIGLHRSATRGCVTASVGNILAPWARTPLSRLVNPEPGRPTLNLHDVVQRGKVVVLNVGQAEHAEELWPGCMLLKEALFRLALSRSRLPINQKRMVAIVMDEANRLLSGQNHLSAEHVAMEMARSNRVSFILACQNLSGLNAVSGDTITDKLMALCGTLVFLTNNCPTTLRLAQRIFGTHLVMRAHRTTVPALAPPQLFPSDEPDEPEPAQVTQVPTEVPLISAETLSRLPAGAARAKLADGSVHEFQCTFD